MAFAQKLFQQPAPEGEYRFFQLAWIVDDLLEATQKWVDVYGVGPWHVLPRRPMKGLYKGQPCDYETQLAVAQSGPVQIELIQNFGEGPNIYTEIFADNRHKGFHHMCTFTNNLSETRKFYEGLGYEAVGELNGGAGDVLYFDMTKDFGLVTEVLEQSPDFYNALSGIADTCASWDGKTDPIRLLRRGGYDTP